MISEPVSVVIPAAGVGKRMQADIPKQYLTINGKTILEYTVEKLLSLSSVGQVVIAVSDDDPYFGKLSLASHADIVRVSGGEERSDSVLNGLTYLQEASDSEWVMVHDAARPCVRHEDIQRLISAVSEHDCGGILAVPVRDTMKYARAGQHIDHTVDRAALWHALTPQMFRTATLYEALAEAKASGVAVTDEASAMEWKGHSPLLVHGHADNIKITQPEDLALATFYLSRS